MVQADIPATRAAALERLSAFVPLAGREYQWQRNFDYGPGQHTSVSMLSPYIRHRILSEEEVLTAVLSYHPMQEAEKFVQEVFWRTYWKGWLEHRPVVWDQYLHRRDQLLIALADEPGSRECYESACEARTGVEPFDAWVNELITTGYLHNHARMWFASIWIFTLKLPWELGADFFLHHLLDGDPAANTLSWRWVAGLHTQGKTYRTTQDNLQKYASRFFVNGTPEGLSRLAQQTLAVNEIELPPAISPVYPKPVATRYPCGLLLTEDNLMFDESATFDALAVWIPEPNQPLAVQVREFKLAAARDIAHRATQTRSHGSTPVILSTVTEITQWAANNNLEQIRIGHLPQGHTRCHLNDLETQLRGGGCSLVSFIRDYDRHTWPYCAKGFFHLKKHIPALIERFKINAAPVSSKPIGQVNLEGV